MPEIFNLTPAEYYMLLAAPKARFSTSVMLTLKDLSLKDVIDIRIEEVKSRSTSKRKRSLAYVYPYTYFNDYSFKPHEKYFHTILKKSGRITLLNLLRHIYNSTPTEDRYGNIIEKHHLRNCFRPFNFFRSSLSGKRTKHGKALKLQMRIELQTQVQDLIAGLKKDPSDAWEITNKLNGLIYLIPPSDLEEIIFILTNHYDVLHRSAYTEQIYAWYLEMDKLREFDGYFQSAVKLVSYRGSSNKFDWIEWPL